MNTLIKKNQVEEQPEKLNEDSMLLVPDVAGSESGHRSSHQDTAVDVRYISQNATITRHNWRKTRLSQNTRLEGKDNTDYRYKNQILLLKKG